MGVTLYGRTHMHTTFYFIVGTLHISYIDINENNMDSPTADKFVPCCWLNLKVHVAAYFVHGIYIHLPTISYTGRHCLTHVHSHKACN